MAKPSYYGGQRMFDGALRRSIAQDNGVKLRKSVEMLMTKAAKGEPWAVQMVAERLDGRVAAMADGEDGDARSLSMADVMRLVLAARASGAEDAVARDTPALELAPIVDAADENDSK